MYPAAHHDVRSRRRKRDDRPPGRTHRLAIPTHASSVAVRGPLLFAAPPAGTPVALGSTGACPPSDPARSRLCACPPSASSTSLGVGPPSGAKASAAAVLTDGFVRQPHPRQVASPKSRARGGTRLRSTSAPGCGQALARAGDRGLGCGSYAGHGCAVAPAPARRHAAAGRRAEHRVGYGVAAKDLCPNRPPNPNLVVPGASCDGQEAPARTAPPTQSRGTAVQQDPLPRTETYLARARG